MHNELNNPSGHYRRYRNYDFTLNKEDEELVSNLLQEILKLKESHKVNQLSELDENKVIQKQKEIESIYSRYRFALRKKREQDECERMEKYLE
jgi:signal transduction histidine kinase